MREYKLNMKVSHPVYGVGVVQGISGGYIRIYFERDKQVRYIKEANEPFVAEQQRKVEEKW